MNKAVTKINIKRNFIILIILLLILCFLGEVSLHLTGLNNKYREIRDFSAGKPAHFIWDKELFWKLRAGAWIDHPLHPSRINSLGMRGKEIELVKPKDCFRIICMGDSVTFGWEVSEENTYGSVLSKFLDKNYPQISFQVLNAGVPGYSTFQGIHYLQNQIIKLKPDLISFCFGFNDFGWALISDQDEFKTRNNILMDSKLFLQKSEIFTLWERIVKKIASKFYQPKIMSIKSSKKNVIRVSLQDFQKNLREMIEICKSNNALPIILDQATSGVPEGIDAYYDYAQKISQELGVEFISLRNNYHEAAAKLEKFKADLPKQWYVKPSVNFKISQRMQIDFQNRPLTKREPELENFLADPIHPNEWGHFIIGKALYQAIQGIIANKFNMN